MNILEKITKLREERHWSEYQLAEHAGITQSTISSWYRKNMLPTIPTLTRICDAFDITISQFFFDENSTVLDVTPEQAEILTLVNKLAPEQREKLIEFLRTL